MENRDITNALRQDIRRMRQEQKVTQEQLSLDSGVGVKTIMRFEAGRGSIRTVGLCAIAEALGCKVALMPTEQGTGETQRNVASN